MKDDPLWQCGVGVEGGTFDWEAGQQGVEPHPNCHRVQEGVSRFREQPRVWGNYGRHQISVQTQ